MVDDYDVSILTVYGWYIEGILIMDVKIDDHTTSGGLQPLNRPFSVGNGQVRSGQRWLYISSLLDGRFICPKTRDLFELSQRSRGNSMVDHQNSSVFPMPE